MNAPWLLHHGDSVDGLRHLADRSVDHAILDPPYSEHVHTKSLAGSTRTRRADGDGAGCGAVSRSRDLGFAHVTQDQREAVADHLARCVRRWVLVFCDEESTHLWRGALSSAGLENVRTGHWVKVGGTPQFTGDRPGTATEAIVIAHQPGKKRWNGGGRPGIWSYPIVLDRGAGETRVHTTQKPIDLMLALVRDFTDHGETILDPFAGSGTTGVAALQLGRRFIGWEQDANYHRVASARLDAAREQPGLFTGPRPKRAKTMEMFASGHENQQGDASESVKEGA